MKVLFFINCFLVVFFLSGCISSADKDAPEEAQLNTNLLLKSTKDVFLTLPSPNETVELIYKSNVKFDDKILNPVKNVPYYETSYSMALNLGIYCADLSYTSLYEQKQITMEYLAAVKALTDGLGLIHLFRQEDILKLEENLFNKDSIKTMVEELFFNSGEFLNDNNRPEIALLVQVGGWIEGIYIAMQLARQSGHINMILVDRIVDQYESLKLVIRSLEDFSELHGIDAVLKDMNQLKEIYNKMIISDNDTVNSKPKINLTNKPMVNVTPELFIGLYHQILKIRNSYTQ